MNATTTAPAANLTITPEGVDLVQDKPKNAAPAKRTPRKTAAAKKTAAPAKKAPAKKAEPKIQKIKGKVEVTAADLAKLTAVNTAHKTPVTRHLEDCKYYIGATFRKATKAEMTNLKACDECSRRQARTRILGAAAKKTARKAPAKKVAAPANA